MPVIFLILFFVIGGLGLFIFKKPKAALELQRRFYARINWRIEPVDMQKELHNTRLMGAFLMAISFFGLIFLWLFSH